MSIKSYCDLNVTWELTQKWFTSTYIGGDGGCSLLAGELKVQLYFHISEQQIVQEQVLEILPMVSEVNAVSEELNKQKSFEVVLISAAAQEGGDITQSHASKYVYQLLCCSSFIYIDV